MNFLETPLSFTRDQRTSRDICRDAVAIEGFATRKPIPSWQRVMYVVAVFAAIVIWRTA
jgi:hypothetical protein